MGGECATTTPLWPLALPFINHSKLLAIFDVPTMSISFLLSRDKDLKIIRIICAVLMLLA